MIRNDQGKDLPANGRFWIDPDRGTMLKSEMVFDLKLRGRQRHGPPQPREKPEGVDRRRVSSGGQPVHLGAFRDAGTLSIHAGHGLVLGLIGAFSVGTDGEFPSPKVRLAGRARRETDGRSRRGG